MTKLALIVQILLKERATKCKISCKAAARVFGACENTSKAVAMVLETFRHYW